MLAVWGAFLGREPGSGTLEDGISFLKVQAPPCLLLSGPG